MDDPDNMPKHQARHHAHKKKINLKLLAAVVVILVIIIGVLAYAFGGSSLSVTAATVVKIGKDGSVFTIGGNKYIFNLASYHANTAYVHITELPVFINPTINVTLPRNSSVRINYSQRYSEMELSLESANNSSASVLVTPLYQALQIQPDSQYINRASYDILSGAVQQNVEQPTTTTVPATTGNSVTTSSTTSVQSTSTTVKTANLTNEAITTALEFDQYYPLMLNYSTLYEDSVACTPQLYNTTFIEHNKYAPTGPFSYQNVSTETPYSLTEKIVSKGDGNYGVDFVVGSSDSNFNNTVAVEILVNISTKTPTKDTVGAISIFSGESYSDLLQNYQTSEAVGNSCAAQIG